MTTERRPAHSPLGASGAERWMNCPGSVELIKQWDLPETDEPEYRSLGTTAHTAAEHCLKTGCDAWEIVGQKFGQHEVDMEMVGAIQVFLDECLAGLTLNHQTYIEFGIDAPDFHPQFYGTLDFGAVYDTHMVIRDFKYGEGIAVDVEDNPQIMYYAYGLLRHHPEVDTVSLGIVQPRGFHPDGPVRVCGTSADYIREWAEHTLKPAMELAAMEADFLPGAWCRFCPAKLICPSLNGIFGAAMTADPKEVVRLTDESIGRSYTMVQAVKSYLKALEEETLRRVLGGKAVPGVKCVAKRANRVWGAEAVEGLKVQLGEDIFTKPELKSPAEIEKLGPAAREEVKKYAYTPESGPTIALASDKRPVMVVQSTTERFAGALAALENA